MKKKVMSLVIVGCIVGALLLGIAITAIVANSKNDRSDPTEKLSSWQSMIKDDALVKRVVIPGAHDAGTKGLPYFAATQDRDTENLLKCGTRYFDLRVSYAKGEYRIYHGPSKGVTLASVLDAVKTFIQTNASEFVILDFQHFDGDAQQGTIAMVEEKLNGLLIVNDTDKTDVEFIDELTVERSRGKCLIAWGRETENILNKNYVFKRNNDDGTRTDSVLHSYYQSSLNKKSSSAYVKQALPHYIEEYKKVNSGLFVLQGQLTDGLFVFGPKTREATHTDRMNEYVRRLDGSVDMDVINIIMRDFVTPYKNCCAIRINFPKSNVKTEYHQEFLTMLKNVNPDLMQYG